MANQIFIFFIDKKMGMLLSVERVKDPVRRLIFVSALHFFLNKHQMFSLFFFLIKTMLRNYHQFGYIFFAFKSVRV